MNANILRSEVPWGGISMSCDEAVDLAFRFALIRVHLRMYCSSRGADPLACRSAVTAEELHVAGVVAQAEMIVANAVVVLHDVLGFGDADIEPAAAQECPRVLLLLAGDAYPAVSEP